MSKAVVNIFGEVIPYQDNSASDWGYVNLTSVRNQIDAVPDAEEIEVHIHSNGGDVNEGFAIHDLLVNSGKKITTIVDGNCFSIATVIFLAGSTREMSKNSQLMIHNPWGGAFGDAEEIQKYADQVKDAENRILNFYVEKTGADTDTIKSMMDAETFMAADKALELKFATSVIEPVKASIRAHFKQNNNSHIMSTVIDKIEAGFNAINALLKDKFGIKAEATEPKAAMVKTQDGEELEITMAGEKPAVGDTVQKGGEDFTGTATLEDGTVITCDAGKITEVTAPASASGNEETKALKEENESLKAQIADQETKLNDLSAQLSTIHNHLKTIKTDYKPGKPQAIFNQAGHDTEEKEKTIDQIKAAKEELKKKIEASKKK